MSEGKKSYLRIILGLTGVVALFLLTHVYLILEIKSLSNFKKKKTEVHSLQKNVLNEKYVEIQKLSSEDRIIGIAENRLGLVRTLEQPEKLVIDKELVQKINKIVNSKYE
ncbi:MAG: hypothetical protein JEY94_02725 [Melioribacteraceae bacterium]|nr:hypothetical protein [Melioribacteraceae bacterium]